MKKALKAVVCLAMVVALVASFAGCAKINYVTNGTIQAIQDVKSGAWENGGSQGGAEGEEGGADNSTDENVIGGDLEPGTYGGVEFKDLNDVAAYYKEAYDYTKTLTAQYKNAVLH